MGSTPADLKRDSEFDQRPDELAELRALLLGQQLVELEALRKRLDDPELRAEELSQILGQAVALSIKRDGGLQTLVLPHRRAGAEDLDHERSQHSCHLSGSHHW